jgi:hypothetical protein
MKQSAWGENGTASWSIFSPPSNVLAGSKGFYRRGDLDLRDILDALLARNNAIRALRNCPAREDANGFATRALHRGCSSAGNTLDWERAMAKIHESDRIPIHRGNIDRRAIPKRHDTFGKDPSRAFADRRRVYRNDSQTLTYRIDLGGDTIENWQLHGKFRTAQSAS